MKIYTKTGDDGTTGLFGGGRTAKQSPRVEAYGSVDELNAALGFARAVRSLDGGSSLTRIAPAGGQPGSGDDLDALLDRIQNDLFEIGADLATPPAAKAASHVRRVEPDDARYLEEAIDRLEEELEPIRQFILPGGAPFAAALHLARAVARRAERRLAVLHAAEPVGAGVLVFLNRLSDLLFVMGRVANRRAGAAEPTWSPRR